MALVLTLGSIAACKKENAYVPPPPQPVGVAKPVQQAVLPYLEITGNAVAYNQIDLEARVQGYLQEIDYQDGAEVKKADTLFVIEPAPYQAQLQEAQATLAATQASLVQAEAEFYRQSTLGKDDFASQSKVDEARAKRDSDKAQITNNQAGVTIAAINLGYTRVTAPFDGIVTAHLVSVGGLVGVDRPDQARDHRPARSDLRHLQRQRAAGVAHQGGEGRARAQAGRRQGRPGRDRADDRGRLSAHRHAGLRRAHDRPVHRHADRAGILQNPDRALLPGFFVRIRVPLAAEKATHSWCPMTALGADQTGSYLLVVDKDDMVEQRTVKTGQLEGSLRVIDSA